MSSQTEALRFRESLALQLNVWGIRTAAPRRVSWRLSQEFENDDAASHLLGIGPWAVLASTAAKRDIPQALAEAQQAAAHDRLPFSAVIWSKHSHALGVGSSVVTMGLLDFAEIIRRDTERLEDSDG